MIYTSKYGIPQEGFIDLRNQGQGCRDADNYEEGRHSKVGQVHAIPLCKTNIVYGMFYGMFKTIQ